MKATRKRLGEIVLRTSNVEEMTAFYRNVIGLEPYAKIGNGNFLKIADDFEGHPQLLAIFEKSWEFSGPKNIRPGDANAGVGTLHHFALVLEKSDFEREKDRLQRLELDLQFADHVQMGWRSIYLHDPDGNSVEFVCYDSAIHATTESRRVRHSSSMQTAATQ